MRNCERNDKNPTGYKATAIFFFTCMYDNALWGHKIEIELLGHKTLHRGDRKMRVDMLLARMELNFHRRISAAKN